LSHDARIDAPRARSTSMNDPRILALARGALVVTPNKRLARELVRAHDSAQLAAGRSAWPSARILPWPAFVAELVALAQDAGLALPSQRLDAIQGEHLWRRIVAADRSRSALVDVDAIASLAADAWECMHAWGEGGESWRGFAHAGEDVDAFVRWAAAYARETASLDAIDAARAPDALVRLAASLPGVGSLDIAAIGFIERPPQQQRLFDALHAAGAKVVDASTPVAAVADSSARVARCATADDELARALDWARRLAERDPRARIGIVVIDLAQRLEAVRAACEDRLCASLQWPGRHDELRPYDVSLGLPLAETPLVMSGLALLRLAQRPLDRVEATALIRSPYVPDAASRWMQRAALDRVWLERGARTIDWRTLVRDLGRVDGELAARWARNDWRRATRLAPREWVERWRHWLDALGWREGRALSSAEYQAEGAWHELLARFVRLTAVAPVLSADEALESLSRLAREQVFQPEAPGARIRVLGLLEATGLAFDALWVAGMGSDAWPRAPEPSPLLPIAWQRERGVPRASAEGELAFARDVTATLAHAAREVVFSYAASADDHPLSPSPLLAGLPPLDAAGPRESTAGRLFGARPALESIVDAFAPALVPGAPLPGGAGLVDKFSACPFQATAAYRWRAEPWPAAVIGLTPIERGKLVHATLDAFWRGVGSHARLVAMRDVSLDAALTDAFATAKATLRETRWDALPPAVAASEGTAILAVVREWLAIERDRSAFRVVANELKTTLQLAGHTLDVRLDRVDALASGGVAVVDYKTGMAVRSARWFDDRPQGMQLALYAKARTQVEPAEAVRALVYAQLRTGRVRAVGLAAADAPWPGRDVDRVEASEWDDVRARLDAGAEAIVSAFASGDARIAPRDANLVCRLCRLRALCRFGGSIDEVPDDSERPDG
jgi:probable DNA repair protein